MHDRISIIIPTRNRLRFLKKTLALLLPQLSNRDQLIIVDDGSTDNSPEKIRQQYTTPAITLLETSHRGTSHARNYGFTKATGTVIAFLDDDCVPDTNWIAAIRDVLMHDKKSAHHTVYQGSIRYEFEKENLLTELFYLKMNASIKSFDREIHYLRTGNCFMRKIVLDSLPYVFDEQKFPFRGEEMDLAVRLQLAGYTICYADNVVVTHCQETKKLTDSFVTAFGYRGRTEGLLSALYSAPQSSLALFGRSRNASKNSYGIVRLNAIKNKHALKIFIFLLVESILALVYWTGFYYGKAQARILYGR